MAKTLYKIIIATIVADGAAYIYTSMYKGKDIEHQVYKCSHTDGNRIWEFAHSKFNLGQPDISLYINNSTPEEFAKAFQSYFYLSDKYDAGERLYASDICFDATVIDNNPPIHMQ